MNQTSPARLSDLVWEADPNVVDRIMRLTRHVSAVSQLVDELTLDVHVLRRDLEDVVASVAGGDPDAQWAAYTYSGMRNLVELVGSMARQCAHVKDDTTSGEITEIQMRNWRGKWYRPAWSFPSQPDDGEVEGS